jgi:hypothetical protein
VLKKLKMILFLKDRFQVSTDRREAAPNKILVAIDRNDGGKRALNTPVEYAKLTH